MTRRKLFIAWLFCILWSPFALVAMLLGGLYRLAEGSYRAGYEGMDDALHIMAKWLVKK